MGLLHRRIAIDRITDRLDIRALYPHGVAALRKKMEVLGYHPQFPLLVTAAHDDGPYRLLDGRHRLEAAHQAGLDEVYVLVHEPCQDFLTEVTLARTSNEASGTNVETTLIDNAALIWRLCKPEGAYTQEEVARALGWSREDVSHYVLLHKIAREAWEVIATTFGIMLPQTENFAVAVDATAVAKSPFTENLLRVILDLTSQQQLDLCTALAEGAITKAKFTARAESYKARNAAEAWVRGQLGMIDAEFLAEALTPVLAGTYDDEWMTTKGPGPKLHKLVASIRERWERKYSIRLLQGDFYTLVQDIGDASIDAILVDPPYNISTDRIYTLDTQPDWDKDFGSWDHLSDGDFCRTMECWAAAYFRILKPGTTGFMFVGEAYLNTAQAIFQAAGFTLKGTFVWCRTNPGPSVTKADLMPAIDLAIQFVKPGAPRTFHYPGDADGAGFNWQCFPVCSGRERLLNAKKETLHPTQKPEALVAYLMELITVPGDLVFDGFMGTGTTAKVAKNLGRKFLGFEQDVDYFAAAQHRVEG